MYLFPMNKAESCLPSRTIRTKLTTATAIQLRRAKYANDTQDERTLFFLHKNSNTSSHLIALIVQSIKLIPTKV